MSEEFALASRALDDCAIDGNVREVAHYLAMSVAIRVLKTVYENDAEIAQWKAQAESMVAAAADLSNLTSIPVTFQTRGSHETYIDANGCYCRHCGVRWGLGEREPAGPCVWPRLP